MNFKSFVSLQIGRCFSTCCVNILSVILSIALIDSRCICGDIIISLPIYLIEVLFSCIILIALCASIVIQCRHLFAFVRGAKYIKSLIFLLLICIQILVSLFALIVLIG